MLQLLLVGIVATASTSTALTIHARVGDLVQVPVCTLPAQTQDPFNDTAIDAKVVFSQGGIAQFTARGFYWQDFDESSPGDWGQLNPTSAAQYVARWTPLKEGTWTYQASCGENVTGNGEAAVSGVAPGWQGFVRQSKTRPTFFEFDNGEIYLPLGENNAWGGEEDYNEWWGKLQPHKANYSRIWIGGGGYSQFVLQTKQLGVGVFDLGAAWRLDRLLLNMTTQYGGFRLLISLHTFNAFRTKDYFACWPSCNPYSDLVSSPDDFWGDAACREYTARFFRYVANRYGPSDRLMAWELFNEVDGVQDYDESTVADWHEWAYGVLADADPNGHVLTTSFAQAPGSAQMDSLPLATLSQTHNYGSNDLGAVVAQWNSAKSAAYNKPTFFGEIGTSSQSPSIECYDDPQGVALLNALIMPLFAGGAGGSNRWWWDGSCEQNEVYYSSFAMPSVIYKAAQRAITATSAAWPQLTASASPSSSATLHAVGTNATEGASGALLLVRNPAFNWKAMLTSHFAPPPSLPQTNVTLHGLSTSHSYTAELFPVNASDASWSGPVPLAGNVTQDSGSIVLSVPATVYGIAAVLSSL